MKAKTLANQPFVKSSLAAALFTVCLGSGAALAQVQTYNCILNKNVTDLKNDQLNSTFTLALDTDRWEGTINDHSVDATGKANDPYDITEIGVGDVADAVQKLVKNNERVFDLTALSDGDTYWDFLLTPKTLSSGMTVSVIDDNTRNAKGTDKISTFPYRCFSAKVKAQKAK